MGVQAITASEAQRLSLQDLRRCEYLTLRAMLRYSAASGWGATATYVGLSDPTFVTPAVAYCFTLLSANKLGKAVPALKIIQNEVSRRGLEPWDPDTRETLEALAAVALGQIAGGEVVEDVLDTDPSAPIFDHAVEEVSKQALGEALTGATGTGLDQEGIGTITAASVDLSKAGGPPPSLCKRKNVQTVLQCDICGDSFDIAFEPYSRQSKIRFSLASIPQANKSYRLLSLWRG
jgi:hypothetical protein